MRVLDFMPPRGEAPDVVRIVEGVRGSVEMRSELVIRFDYGHVVPWVRRIGDTRLAVAGPDALCFRTPAHTRARTCARSPSSRSRRASASRSCSPGIRRTRTCPSASIREVALAETESFWREWNAECTVDLPPELSDRAAALADGAEDTHLRAHRRHRRGADDLAARVDRRRAQLGLPLLLAARRDADAARAPARRPRRRGARSGGSGCCARSPATPPTCRSCTASPASAA